MALAGNLLAGRYHLDEPIGTGGFSQVWCATDTVMSRPVAVKLLRPGYAQQPEALARFRAEARHAAVLWHENIAHIYDYDEPADGLQPYLVMELVDGPSLACVLARGPLDARRTMGIIAQTATGLQAAHAIGLIHRDIKPGNLLLASSGTVKITDFGISHAIGSVSVTATGIVMGTAGYLAPERIAGAQATPASDLYALGIVAYECLAGAPPFEGAPLDVACAHREQSVPPLPASVPATVSALVMQLVAKEPAWRPSSGAEVAHWAGRLRDDLQDGVSVGAGRIRHPLAAPAAAPAIAPAAFAGDTGWQVPAAPPLLAAPPPRSRARTGARRGRRPVLVVACATIALLIGMAMAVTMGVASVQRPAGALPYTVPRHSAGGIVAAPPAHHPSSAGHRRNVNPGSSPRTSTGDTGTAQVDVSNHRTVTGSGTGRQRGHEKIRRHRDRGDANHGQGNDNGHGNGHDTGQGNGNGNDTGQGNGNDTGQGNGNDNGHRNGHGQGGGNGNGNGNGEGGGNGNGNGQVGGDGQGGGNGNAQIFSVLI